MSKSKSTIFLQTAHLYMSRSELYSISTSLSKPYTLSTGNLSFSIIKIILLKMERLNTLQSHLTTQIVEVTQTSKFKQMLQEVTEGGQEFTVCIFTAGVTNKKNGKTWCSDCDRAKYGIDEVLIKNVPKNEKVIKCIVEQQQWSGRSDHPYKQDKVLKLRSVPTVILFQNGRDIVAKIDRDEEFQNHEMFPPR